VNENNKRLEILHRNHYDWLLAVAMKLTRNKDTSEDLIQELYIYLGGRNDKKLWYKDSFNLQYCRSFIHSRFYNLVTKEDRLVDLPTTFELEDEEYDVEWDEKLETTYNNIIKELDRLKKTKKWSSAKLFELYWFTDKTYDEVSKDINISKSTTFINVKKIKKHLKQTIENPYEDNKGRNTEN